MVTLILALIHGLSKNSSFRPELLYIGTIWIGLEIVAMISKVFSH